MATASKYLPLTTVIDPATQNQLGIAGTGQALVSPGGKYANISTNTTTLVKTGAGILHSLTINTKGASSNTAAIYDGITAGGTLIGTVDTTSGVLNLPYGIQFEVGLCIVTATGTAANLTVSFS